MPLLPSQPHEMQIIQWSNACPHEELCGVLLRQFEGFVPYQLANVASDRTTTFTMEEKPFLDAIKRGDVWGTWHVHPGSQDDDGPSIGDMDRANAWGLPGCILVRRTMRFKYYTPDGFKTSIFQRPYVPGIFDCYALVKDALAEYVGFEAEELDREQLDDDGCLPDVMACWESQGWEMLLQPRPGRVMMINATRAGRCSHLGLVISGYEMIHQLRGHPSKVDYLGSWQKWSLGYLAHPVIEAKVTANSWDRLPFNPADYEGPRKPAKAPSRPPQRFSPRPSIETAGREIDPQVLKVLKHL